MHTYCDIVVITGTHMHLMMSRATPSHLPNVVNNNYYILANGHYNKGQWSMSNIDTSDHLMLEIFRSLPTTIGPVTHNLGYR